MKVVAFVPAKSTSSRIPNKNIKNFNGEPLFLYTVKKLMSCEFIDEVYVDSECDNILKLAKNIGANTIKRSRDLATNKTDGNSLFYNECIKVDADIYIQHLCTSPFIKTETIKKSIEILTNSNFDSVVLGEKSKKYKWVSNEPKYDINNIPNSFDLDDEICESMGLYVVEKDAVLKYRRRIGDEPKMIFGEAEELVDINNKEDFDFASLILKGLKSNENNNLKLISRFLSTPILSDILDDLNISSVLPPLYKSNLKNTKIFGRARTLHLRRRLNSDPKDIIYDALDSYKLVSDNDIIIVQNDCPELAYFGDLNMSLAIRSGAIGAIIGGVTRDNNSTSIHNFPVFSKGSYCRDIKDHGAVESINKPINLDGVSINPNDLIFADVDGVVIIPGQFEREVLTEALSKISKEKDIVQSICLNVEPKHLIEKFGNF
ncbi:cytidyltransferase [bacterium]|nr:cytidyltransferase [bacterium]